MTSAELCRTAGLTKHELRNWIDYGLLDANVVGRNGRGHQREFSQDQAERACLLRALHRKGVSLAQLARADLADLAGQAFVVFDGRELRACRDAVAAIAAAVRARGWCCVVDIAAVRQCLEKLGTDGFFWKE